MKGDNIANNVISVHIKLSRVQMNTFVRFEMRDTMLFQRHVVSSLFSMLQVTPTPEPPSSAGRVQ